MGLFSKSKNDKNSSAPPAPPSAPPMPPSAPPMPSSNSSNSVGSSGNSVENSNNVGNMVPPPIPGGNLDGIKGVVASESNNFNMNNSNNSPIGNNNNNNSQNSNNNNNIFDDFSDDSLFDFSDLNIPAPNASSDRNTSLDLASPRQAGNMYARTNEYELPRNNNYDYPLSRVNSEPYETSSQRLVNEDFIKNKNYGSVPIGSDNFFITTAQFKALLEIVESVKLKVKESTEKHLRLLDIKSEEDIEYENLRKDFQYIEDKLYEADSILFEK